MADQNINNMSVTWNSGGTTFDAIKMNVTDTASAAASLLLLLQVGGADRFKVSKGGAVTMAGALLLTANDGAALGVSGTAWSDLFLASGAVVNFNAGDVTITHSANALAFAGASSGYTFDAAIATTGGANITSAGVFLGAVGSASAPTLSFTSDTNLGLYRAAADSLAVAAGGVEIARFVPEGLGIGATAPFSMTGSSTLGIFLNEDDNNVHISRTSDVALQMKRRGTDGRITSVFKNETNVGGITVTTSATSFDTSSDERLKDFIGLYDPKKAIGIIRADPVRDFHWKSDGAYAVGWSAQSSYAISNDLATPGKGDPGDEDFIPWSIDKGNRTPYLWAAMSAVLDRLEVIESRLR